MNAFIELVKDIHERETLEDIVSCGLDPEYACIKYNAETLYFTYETAIWDLLKEAAENYGFSVLHYVERCYSTRVISAKKHSQISNPAVFKQQVVWAAVEQAALQILNSRGYCGTNLHVFRP